MLMIKPLVSIIITAFKYEKFVSQCIESCLSQKDFDDFEILLIDDGSPDATATIAKNYEPMIRVISIENGGVEKASNLGIKVARGDFCVRVDADDLLYPSYLSTLMPHLNEKTWDFFYPNYDCVDAKGDIISHVKLPCFDSEEIKQRGDFLATGTLYRKAALEKIGGYNPQIANCGLENYELILNMLNAGCKGLHIDSSLFAYRIHDENMSNKRRESIITYGWKLAKIFRLPSYTTNSNHPYGLTL